MAKRYLGDGGAIDEWSASHRTLDGLRRIALGADMAEITAALDAVIAELGGAAFPLLHAPPVARPRGGRLIAASERLNLSNMKGKPLAADVRRTFTENRRVPVRGKAPARPAGETADPTHILSRHLHGAGLAGVTSVYSPAGRRGNAVGLLALDTGRSATDTGDACAILRIALPVLMQSPHMPTRDAAAPDLPKGERSVLAALACGMQPGEIATERGTSVRTVRAQLDSARQRLGARSNAQAVAIALLAEAIPRPGFGT